jgi:hypothetical protein
MFGSDFIKATAIIESYIHCSLPNYSHSLHVLSFCQFRTPHPHISSSVTLTAPRVSFHVLQHLLVNFLTLPSCIFISLISSIFSSHILTPFYTLLSQSCTPRRSLVAARGCRFPNWATSIVLAVNKWVIFNAVYLVITYKHKNCKNLLLE